MLEIPAWSCLPRLLLQRLQCITFPESKLIQHARRMHSVYSYTMLYSNYTIHIMLYSVWNIRVLIFDTILVVPVLCCLPAKCSTWGGNTTCSMYLQCRRLWVSSRNMPYLGYLWLEGLYPVTSYISHPQNDLCNSPGDIPKIRHWRLWPAWSCWIARDRMRRHVEQILKVVKIQQIW